MALHPNTWSSSLKKTISGENSGEKDVHILFDQKKAFLPKMMVANMAFFELCVLCIEEVETFLLTPGVEMNLNKFMIIHF